MLALYATALAKARAGLRNDTADGSVRGEEYLHFANEAPSLALG